MNVLITIKLKKGHLGGLDNVLKIRDRSDCQIFVKMIIFILAQSWKFSFFGL